jgi:hypothetical protein
VGPTIEKSFCRLRFRENAVAVSALLPTDSNIGAQLGVKGAPVGEFGGQIDQG